MTENTETPPGNRWEHPTQLEKVRRNEAANARGEYNPNNADDHPNAIPAPPEGFTLENVTKR